MSGDREAVDGGHVWGAVGPNAAELWNRCMKCRADEGSVQGRLPCPKPTSPPPTADAGGASLTDAEDLRARLFVALTEQRVIDSRKYGEAPYAPISAEDVTRELARASTAQDEGAGEVERLRAAVEALADEYEAADARDPYDSTSPGNVATRLRAVVDRAKGGA